MDIPVHYPNVVLHEFIVMPDHVHGIIELGVQNFEPLPSQHNSESIHQQPRKHNEYQKIIPRSVGSIIRGYKIGVTKWFRENDMGFRVWQRNYYECIIRNKQSYDRITRYIVNNPVKWGDKMKNGKL